VAVSKRLRFEILRRDNHTCYYCGRKPPEVELTVDHVVPKALGGTDEAKNLVAACTDCNGGKTSIAPDSPLVDKVDADAERWSAAVQAAIDKANADHEATEQYRSQFLQAWNSYRRPAPLDELWRPSIESFRARGLPIEILIDALHRAMAKPNVADDAKFRYTCGIAWKKISEIEKRARTYFEAAVPASADADAESRADDEWEDPTTPLVIQTVTAVWLSTWQASHGEDPPAGTLEAVREEAEELYPEWFYASPLVAAAESAATQGSTSLEEYVEDGEEESLLRTVARSFFRGWAFGAHQRGEPSRPTPSQWLEMAVAARYADAAGYSWPNITMTAYQAGANQSAELKMHTVDDAIRYLGEPTDDDRERLSQPQEWIDLAASRAESAVKTSNRKRNA